MGKTTLNQSDKPTVFDVFDREGILYRQRGERATALCPIHPENTPSFTIYPDGTAHCFGCGWHGDSIALVQEIHNLSFKGALSHLGLTLDNSPKARRERERAKRRRAAIQRFREWERRRYGELVDMRRVLDDLKRKALPGTVESTLSEWYLRESEWLMEMEVLDSGTDAEKLDLYRRVCHE